jgi:hypothetical protein
MADSAAILFTVLLAVLEIRHYMNNGNRPRWRKFPCRSRSASP